METVSVRELRNHGGEVLDRVARGAVVVVPRDGAEVAELRGHDLAWAASAVPGRFQEIERIGSTAVPGLMDKPVIREE
jgi:antitoxin (DNA-binding transcriptional repressor) of toxin-antitoxin stability system